MADRLVPILLILISSVKECHGDSYSITGLVVSSAMAVALFIIVIIVAIFITMWADFLQKYYKKRGIQKSPRITILKRRAHSTKGTLSKEQEIQLQVQAQQKLRPRLPNTWRAGDEPRPQQQNGDVPVHIETYTTTGDFHFGAEDIGEDEYATVQKSPVVMEIKDDKEPHSIRNYESVMDLPEESPERPAKRTSQHSHIGLITPGEMVEIPLQNEKSTHF